jgi:hypothetical protein
MRTMDHSAGSQWLTGHTFEKPWAANHNPTGKNDPCSRHYVKVPPKVSPTHK